MRKSFLSNGETPVQSRVRGQVRPGQGRVLFGDGGNDGGGGLGFSPAPLQPSSSALPMEMGEDKDDDDESDEDDDSEKKEEDEWELGSAQDDEEAEGTSQEDRAAALYASYFLSPQNRLPINHPDHDYSFQFQGKLTSNSLALLAPGD